VKDLSKFYINGEWVDPVAPRLVPVENPATEEAVARLALGSREDVDQAVTAARSAFDTWSVLPMAERLACLERLIVVYEARYDEMAQAITEEMGAPPTLSSTAQAASGLSHAKIFLDELRRFTFEFPLRTAEKDLIIREPVGVCGLITPWNWPMNQIVLKVIPAVSVGCTVILKPSEVAPLSGHLFAEFMHEAGYPPGVFNLLHGDGPGVGAAMSSHPGIDMISFTGSTRAGEAIAVAAAPTHKRLSLELGGKSPNIIFADTDVDAAARRGAKSCFVNTGQSCDAPTRMLVERSAYDHAVQAACDMARAMTPQANNLADPVIGPLVSKQQFDRVQAMIAMAISEGARLAEGGLGRPDGITKGHFVRPTVFADVRHDMRIAREEVFGPVLVIIPFDTEAEAIRMANDSAYGLASYIQTDDKHRAQRVARAMRTGVVRVNGASRGPGSPFGGYKQSGNGREGGPWGIEEFLETKAVSNWG